jgi:hypothetical protein
MGATETTVNEMPDEVEYGWYLDFIVVAGLANGAVRSRDWRQQAT